MEQQQQQQVAQTEDSGGISTGTIIVGSIFLIVLAAIGYYIFAPKTIAKIPDPNDPMNQKIPGAGQVATGILTDPNFFNGLTNFATTINSIVQSNKKTNVNTSTGGNVGAIYPQTQQEYVAANPVGPYNQGPWAPTN